MPPVLAILIVILVFAAIATCVVPRGQFERTERRFPNWITHVVTDGDTRQSIASSTGADLADVPPVMPSVGDTILIPVGGMVRSAVTAGTYAAVPTDEVPSLPNRILSAATDVTLAPIEGFIERAQIIGFVLLLGGSFGILLSTGAIDRGLEWTVIRLAAGGLRWTVIPTCFMLFSLGGAVFGMGESTIAFVLITVPLAIRLGYDTITGVAMCYMASQVGFAGAFFNPFTIGIAQGIAELPYLSGSSLRYVVWTLFTLIGMGATMWWARRVAADPTRSPTVEIDRAHRLTIATEESTTHAERPTGRDLSVIVIALGSVVMSGVGVAQLGWYINEMAALFVVAGIIGGLLAGSSVRKMSDDFVAGASLMVQPCLIIAVSAGIVFVLTRGQVLDTILHTMATPMATLRPGAAAVGMMMFQAVLNFFVPSGSGQAAMTMPLVTPLCDLVGLHRQIGVLAFQFGDGLGNLIVPTSAVLMGVLVRRGSHGPPGFGGCYPWSSSCTRSPQSS